MSDYGILKSTTKGDAIMTKPYMIIAHDPAIKVGEYSDVMDALHYAGQISRATHREHTVEKERPMFFGGSKVLARFAFAKKAA